jgi:hypothetical protein
MPQHDHEVRWAQEDANRPQQQQAGRLPRARLRPGDAIEHVANRGGPHRLVARVVAWCDRHRAIGGIVQGDEIVVRQVTGGLERDLTLVGPGIRNRRPEGPFAGPTGPFLQWFVREPGQYRLVSDGPRLVGAVDGRLPFTMTAAQHGHRGTLLVQ